ncbi:MAG: epoxyqueuosine reductase QueH [Paenibacillaceae bacterium]|nr:epoxyqueuosine reductase QueH [Paenibacillaceae bacterium]
MNPRNYQKELDQIIEEIKVQNKVPKLLIHSCCAPCSSYVLEYLSQYFEITVYFYNPNIYPPLEYIRRVEEQDRLIQEMNFVHPVTLQTGAYEPQEFYRIVEGLEKEPEGGIRCFHCYELRLQEAAKIAQAGRFDYFTTTLSISPLKNADKLNEIGEKLGREYRVAYLPSDFKKKNGYKRSVELSKEHDLYRQDYCGCVFSQRERQTKESSC